MPKFLIRARHLVIPLYSIYCSRVISEIFSPLEHRSPNLSSFDVVGLIIYLRCSPISIDLNDIWSRE